MKKLWLTVLIVLFFALHAWAGWDSCGWSSKSSTAPTFVIASSSSLSIVKRRADYVCDGIDDQVEIQAAIDALPATGGLIHLASGNYSISSAIVLNKKGLTLEGDGLYSRLKLAAGSTQDLIKVNPNAPRMENMVLRDLRLEGNKVNVTATVNGVTINRARNFYMYRVYIKEFTGNGIAIVPIDDTVHDLHFVDVVTESCDGNGWYMEGLTYGVYRFFIRGGYSYGNLRGMYLNGYKVTNSQISNYDFEYNEQEGVLCEGTQAIGIVGGHIIQNSKEISGTYSGVNLKKDSGGYGPYYNVFSGVNFYAGQTETQKHCVYFDNGAKYNKVAGCQVTLGFTDSAFGAYHTAGFSKNNIDDINEVQLYKNNSGVTLSEGDIVVLDTSDSTGRSVTTTASADNSLVIGAASKDIPNGEVGYIITKGPVWPLHVNGTTDIAVGDFIGTFTEAGVGQKSTVGSGHCIAIALEAYTADDSNGAIKAMIIHPR